MGTPIRSDAVNYGENAENAPRRDDRFVRCSRCGFICHLDRDRRSTEGSKSGWGITNTQVDVSVVKDSSGVGITDSSGEYVGYGGKYLYDPIVTGGCPQCGTYLYNK